MIFENNEEKDVYIRIIKEGKIKESIFCYWSLLYDKFNKKEKRDFEEVKIKEKVIENDKKSIILQTEKDYSYNTEINLIELKKFIVEKLKENGKLVKLLKYLDKIDNEILFLGIIGY